jgi:hypothetical protein
MIIEAYGDFVRVKHIVSMRQVNPNKASRRKPNKCFHIIKTTHDFFQRLIKQYQSFERSHATAKTTKHTIKNDIKHGMQKSKPQSKQAPFVPLFA